MCIYHNRPISERDWLKGRRHTDCSKCKNLRAERKSNRGNRRKDGTIRPWRARSKYKQIMKRRNKDLGNGNTLRGIELFERSTGLKIS